MRTGRKKKHEEQMVFLLFNFCSVNSKKTGKTTFCCSLNSAILRTWGTTKTKMTLSTKRVFGVFCFQEQKTVFENTKQTGPNSFVFH